MNTLSIFFIFSEKVPTSENCFMAKESNKLDAIKVKYLRFDINSAKRQRGPNGGRILPNKQLAP